MNNLTPLQEVASRIYAAKIASGILSDKTTYHGADTGNREFSYNSISIIQQSLDQAKALLKATKPEPLEWYKQAEAFHQSGIEYFTIAEYDTDINGDKLVNIEYQLRQDGKLIGYFFDLDIAKQFAEHIRTR